MIWWPLKVLILVSNITKQYNIQYYISAKIVEWIHFILRMEVFLFDRLLHFLHKYRHKIMPKSPNSVVYKFQDVVYFFSGSDFNL